MFYDIDDSVKIEQLFDQRDIIVGDYQNETIKSTALYNLISPEGLRGMLFGSVGEDNIMCVGDNFGIIGEIFMDD